MKEAILMSGTLCCRDLSPCFWIQPWYWLYVSWFLQHY